MALAAIALAGATGATGIAEPRSRISIDIDGLRSIKGNILICLTADAASFPDCRKDPAAVKRVIAARDAALVDLGAVTPGTYAIALIHDENGNGKLDTRLMIPAEGFGFSRNPVVTFGPPKFRAARFDLGDDARVETVRMKYML
jgi:uncharacterized protein (DUF2141 family)